jgi:hypothetical protein
MAVTAAVAVTCVIDFHVYACDSRTPPEPIQMWGCINKSMYSSTTVDTFEFTKFIS